MSVAINDDGELSASELNRYLGASVTNELKFVGTYVKDDGFSLNQIFFATSGSNPPSAPAIPAFSLSALRGKRFALYTSEQRTLYHTNSWIQEREFDLPIFMGWFGFGDSGMLNPANRGFPIAVSVKSQGDISITVKTGEGFTWTEQPFFGGEATFITTTGDAIRIFADGGRLAIGELNTTTVNLSVAPCLSQTLPSSGEVSDLRGAHTMTLTFVHSDRIIDDGRGEINDPPPIDDPFGPLP
jgi:hypothetical protein